MNTANTKGQLVEALRKLLLEGDVRTQDDICNNLEAQGFEVNQSKISRLLRKLGAVKAKNEFEEVVYRLSKEPLPPTKLTPLQELIIDVVHNETTIVVFTSPGCASLIARLLDYTQEKSTILATVAGDDTIFVIPKSVAKIDVTVAEVETLLLAR